MSSLVKFADTIRGVNAKLAELQATTANLSLVEKKALLEALSKDVSAAVAKEDAPARRLASVKAASASTDPQRTKDAFKVATKGLQALGYDLEAIATSGSIADLDAKMRDRKWAAIRCTGLKVALARIGAVA